MTGLENFSLFNSSCARVQIVRLQPRDPGGEHEVGLEGIDRGAQRLQDVGLDHRRRTEQSGGDAGQQLALGQAVLHQARMHVDRARHRDAVQRQLLIVDAPSREPGEQGSDERDETDDEAQPKHSLYSDMRYWRRN